MCDASQPEQINKLEGNTLHKEACQELFIKISRGMLSLTYKKDFSLSFFFFLHTARRYELTPLAYNL